MQNVIKINKSVLLFHLAFKRK